jgi:methanogenic corrinoid protein MtbC1
VAPTTERKEKIAEALGNRGLREGRFVIIGGGPTSEAVRDYVGADAWTLNPVVGIDMCRESLALRRR